MLFPAAIKTSGPCPGTIKTIVCRRYNNIGNKPSEHYTQRQKEGYFCCMIRTGRRFNGPEAVFGTAAVFLEQTISAAGGGQK